MVSFPLQLFQYWCHRADDRLGNLPQGNQEPLVVKDRIGRLPDEPEVRKAMEHDAFSFQFSDTVECRFTGGDILTGSLHIL